MINARKLHQRYASTDTPYVIAYNSGLMVCFSTREEWEEALDECAEYEPFDIDVDEEYWVAIIDDGDFD